MNGNPRNPRLVAQVELTVEVYAETEPGQSNPIVGTELPHDYLVIRSVSERGTVVTGLKGHLALLDWDDNPLDADGLFEEAVRDALSAHAPDQYRETDQ